MHHRTTAVRIARWVGAFALILGPFLAAPAARAAFPGPDGRIAFVSGRTGTFNIFSVNPDGSDVRQLTDVAPDVQAADPSWSADGRHIVFDERPADFSSGPSLFAMNADGSGQHRVLKDPWFRDFDPSFSPDGTSIVFNRCVPDFGACAIYAMASDGTGLRAITPFQPQAEIFDWHPRFSPDGTTIAFTSFNRDGVVAASYLMNADGSDVRRITPADLTGTDPDWAPDGSRLVFWTHCCDPKIATIDAVNPDGTGVQQLTHPSPRHDVAPVYSRAGDRIAFDRYSPDFSKVGIYVMNADGTGASRITDDGFNASWGPAT